MDQPGPNETTDPEPDEAPAKDKAAEGGILRRAAKNAVSVIVGDAGGEVVTAYTLTYVALRLGPTGFGELSEAQAFLEPFESLAWFGLTNVALTTAARRGCDGPLRGTILGMQLVFGAVAATAALVVAQLTGRIASFGVLLACVVAMMWSPFAQAAQLPFQFERTMHRLLVVPFLAAVCRLGATLAVSRRWNTPVGYQAAAVTGSVVVAVLIMWRARKHYPDPLRFDRGLARELLVAGWPAAVLSLIVMVYARASYLFLHGAGPAVQGQYAAADRLLRPLLHVAGVLVISSLPTVATLAVQGEYDELIKVYRRGIRRVLLLATPLLAAVWLLSGWVIRRWAPAYVGAIWPFCVLAVGALFMFLNQLSTTFVLAMSRFRVLMWIAAGNLVAYLVLATILVPRYGALGAAIATAGMEALNTVAQLVVVSRLLEDARAQHRAAHTA